MLATLMSRYWWVLLLRGVLAVRLRKEIEGEWWMALGGLVSILFGVATIARPGAGAVAVLTLIGFWSIVTGILLALASFRLKSAGGSVPEARVRTAAGVQ